MYRIKKLTKIKRQSWTCRILPTDAFSRHVSAVCPIYYPITVHEILYPSEQVSDFGGCKEIGMYAKFLVKILREVCEPDALSVGKAPGFLFFNRDLPPDLHLPPVVFVLHLHDEPARVVEAGQDGRVVVEVGMSFYNEFFQCQHGHGMDEVLGDKKFFLLREEFLPVEMSSVTCSGGPTTSFHQFRQALVTVAICL